MSLFICWLCFLFCPFCPGENSKKRHKCLRRGPLAAAWLGYTKDLLVPGSSEATTWDHGAMGSWIPKLQGVDGHPDLDSANVGSTNVTNKKGT